MSRALLVTGASGQFGRRVVTHLLDTQRVAPERVAATTRDPRKVADLAAKDVEVRRGDFDDAESLESAFAGVERLLIVSTDGDTATRIRQHRTAVEAAKNAGVGFIAYTSMPKPDGNPLSLGEVHHATETAIRAAGIPFAFLRNNWYIENETAFIQAVVAGAPLTTSAGEGRIGWAARDDYAQAAAAVLAANGPENVIYELSGPLRTYDELATVLSNVLGREVPVRHVDDATFERVLSEAGLPEPAVKFVAHLQQGIRAGGLEVESGDLPALLGRAVTPLNEGVARIVAELSAPEGAANGS